MNKVELKNVSASKVRLYLKCPRQYYYAYGEGIFQEETMAIVYGKYIHSVLEDYVKHLLKNRKDKDLEALYSISQSRKKDYASMPETGEYSFFESDLVLNKFASQPIDHETIYGIEKFFDLDILGMDINIVGRIDRIDTIFTEQNEKYLHIIDYKTGRHKVPQSNITQDIQFIFYITAVYHLYRKFFKKLRFTFFYTIDSDQVSAEVEYNQEYYKTIKDIVLKMSKDEDYDKVVDQHCKRCPAFKTCKPNMSKIR